MTFVKVGISGSSGGSVYLECVNFQQVDDEANGKIYIPKRIVSTIDQLKNSSNFDDLDGTVSVVFRDNVFMHNTASNGQGILTVKNFPKISSINDAYILNFDAFQEVNTKFASNLNYQENFKNGEKFQDLYQNNTYEDKKFASSIIHFEKLKSIYIEQIRIDSNILIEPKFSNKRASIFYFKDISDSVQIISLDGQSIKGSYSASEIDELLSNLDHSQWLFPGTKLRLLQLVPFANQDKILELKIENWTFNEISFNAEEILNAQNICN
ncbi:UNKNOWN [Stylonychia lemnae]|uniref:Uncharacterized protein n=1 Tax=Stylonychia lemnae TaxID=5949 RepID=A0A077ZZK0_STYLE|nr:UNKNOWN [Stylonychia lemnae]|eukprot:CDW74663.1 UNKNOWN [Stylonychia lemnae]